MKNVLIALLKGVCKLLRAMVVFPLLVLLFAVALALGVLVGGGFAALIGGLVAASITIGIPILVVQAIAR